MLDSCNFLDIIKTINNHETVYNLWCLLNFDLRQEVLKIISEAQYKPSREKLIPALFLRESSQILDILIPSEVLNGNFEWLLVDDFYGREEIVAGIDDYNFVASKVLYTAKKPLIFVAAEENRHDLLEYLLGRNAHISYLILSYIANDDKIKLVMDYWDLENKENVCKLLSACSQIDQIQYLAAKGIFIGYERSDFEEFRIPSPIINFMMYDITKIPELIDLGIKIIPDASDYIQRFRNKLKLHPIIAEIFIAHGGDPSLLQLGEK